MKADLHLHTYYSDGTDSPAQLVERAAMHHFDVVAITDHDTVAGIPEAIESGESLGIKIVPGVEITSKFKDQELHLLAYFQTDCMEGEGWRDPQLLEHLKSYETHRLERAKRIVQKLNALGMAITIEEIQEQASSNREDTENDKVGTIGRPHVAAAMVAGKHVASIDQAFSEYLKKGRPAWVDKERADVKDVIDLVHRIGGITSLAHPGFLRDENIPSSLLKDKIDAVEVYHSRHTSSQSQRLRTWARENDLLVTGGSDCHGMLKGEPLMGRVELNGEDLDRFLLRLESGDLKTTSD